MIEVALTFGIVIFLGVLFILVKLPRSTVLTLLGHHVWLDVGVTVLTLWIHWGTMTGLMAAAIAGMICSVTTAAGRWLIGYRHKGKIHRGVLT